MSDETRQARADLTAAYQELDAVEERDRAAGRSDETDEYLAANQAVIDAEKPLPWFKRVDIDWGFYPDRPAAQNTPEEVDEP